MSILNGLTLGDKTPLRVSAYCRVSTEEESQGSSYETQRDFFENEIRSHPGWMLAGVYGDYARTGTQVEGRTGFQKMMRRAEQGCIDYIIAKSISRFSRSTSDTLFSLRELSSLGVGVYFIEQGLDTLGGYGDLILSLLATIAEMESESISENVKTTLTGMNAKGTPLQRASYGYAKDGKEWVINPTEALRVKLAYLMAANGYAFSEIATRLNQFERADRTGRDWDSHRVKRTLLSEAYIGDILTNKTAMVHVDGKGRKQVQNDNLEDQYYIDSHHAPLVGQPLWEMVSKMIEEKKLAGQERFEGVEEVRKLAKRDRLLDEVRKYLPGKPGRWMG